MAVIEWNRWMPPRDCEADIVNLLAQLQQVGDAYEPHRSGWNGANLSAGVRMLKATIAQADALATAVEALMGAMAGERPLREPETHADVLAAWDVLKPALAAYRAAREGAG